MKTQLLLGDCIDKLKELESNSVDSIVTDPPYGIGFMGKAWDTFVPTNVSKAVTESEKSFTKTKVDKQDNPNLKGRKNAPIGSKATFAGTYDTSRSGALNYQLWCEEWARECIRVLKPGGHILASCSPRMYHRLAAGFEDAGFEIRDQIMWVYGSGFPKSHNIGKAVDKKEGNEREVVDTKEQTGAKFKEWSNDPNETRWHNQGFNKIDGKEFDITKGNSKWEGWGTALKPAHEPIVMARKPLIGTVADNVLEWGTGGINIDGCRVGTDDTRGKASMTAMGQNSGWNNHNNKEVIAGSECGRFPANIIFDEEAGKILDQQSGTQTGQRGIVKGTEPSHNKNNAIYGDYSMVDGKYAEPKDGLGGASRFFYCPKAQKKDRDAGVEYVGQVVKGRDEGQDGTNNPFKLRPSIGATFAGNQTTSKIGANPNKPTQPRSNIHPTVKPTELMKYLIRLVTPKGGIVLDPFMGSGSTGKAAVLEGMEFIGIEREREYFEIAEQRINHVNKPAKHTEFFE